MTATSIDELRVRLSSRNERLTRPRKLVLTVLQKDSRHLSADEILELANKTDSSVHRSSIYRTLEALCDLGLVQHVHVAVGPTLYHLALEEEHHIHIQCDKCGLVTDASSELARDVVDRFDASTGFAVDLSHVALSGLCPNCR